MKVNDFKKFVASIDGTEANSSATAMLMAVCHGLADQCGWWKNPKTGERVARPVPELLMLCVSELAEAMEGHRKGLQDDKLPQYDMLTVELADCVIRIMDFAGGMNLPLAGALADKLAFNAQRADHKPENRAKSGGKAY